jgi:hypothetical protein
MGTTDADSCSQALLIMSLGGVGDDGCARALDKLGV